MNNETTVNAVSASRIRGVSRQKGFSLFELVVFIISVAIIYAYAANRFAGFPAEAERANFQAIAAQLQTAINIELMVGVGSGRISDSSLIVGSNPMDFLLEAPSNYLGAYNGVDDSALERRSWYFDLARGELVYLINDASGAYLELSSGDLPTQEIRFKIVADYSEFDRRTGLPLSVVGRGEAGIDESDRVRKLAGILMRPVFPYRWESGVIADFAATNNS